MKRIIGYFTKGLLFIIPIGLTVYILYLVFALVNRVIIFLWDDPPQTGVMLSLLGIAVGLVLITLVGVLTSLFITRPLFIFIERLLSRLPLVKQFYLLAKDIINAFVGDKKTFDKPVMISLIPGGSTKVLGFVTQNSLGIVGLEDHVSVYLPQSYNFSGNLICVSRQQVQPLTMDSSELLKFVVSGGVAVPHTPAKT